MGYLKQIDIENFKSWRGKQIIGPFMRFSCIIGPNGSGKSNVMDALSFAMGERASSLRVKHLRDLIHGANVGQPVSNSARVGIRYCDEQEQETVFTRIIVGDSSECQINGVRVSLTKYMEELEKIGIVTKAQNCLVFQGAVESIALKDPRERTKMLEVISQSKEYAGAYVAKKAAMMKAVEETQFHFNKKKSATVERKQISKEQIEAQKYQALLDELHENRLQLVLAELYHNEKAIDAINVTLGEKQSAAASKRNERDSWEQTVKLHKKEHGRLTREQQQVEKEICGQEHTLSQARAQYVKAKVSTSHHMKKIEETREALRKKQKLLGGKRKELEEDRREIAELERSWRSYERQIQEEGAMRKRDIELDKDQLERYKELKELARKQGAVLSQQAEKLQWEVKADREKMIFDQRRKKEMEVGIRNSCSHLEDLTSREEKLKEYIKKCMSSIEDCRQNEESLSAELQWVGQRSTEVNQELGVVMEELGNARLDSHESRRQQQRRELLEKLCRLFPETVYGRLSDLCSPVHKKYQLAVTKIFGSNMNAIVVASEKVARDCISFLKVERAEPETFLPVDYLVVSPLNERLREIPSAKMAVDVVKFNTSSNVAHLKKVVQYVCGNALVCENIRDARSLAFDREERIRTVSLDGTLFKTSGVISGGSSFLRTKARCWDEQEMKQLKQRKEQLTSELRNLMKQKRKESELNQVVAQAHGAQTRLKYSKADFENLEKKAIPKCQAEISRLESELANLTYEIETQEENLSRKNQEMERLRQQIDQMEDMVFSDFCAEIGVDSIREYEQEYLKQQAEVDKKRMEFETQCERLRAKLQYGEEQLEQERKKLRLLENSIVKEEGNVAGRKEDQDKLLEAVEKGEKRLRKLKEQLASKKGEADEVKAELDQKTQALRHINNALVRLQREVMTAESALETKRLARHNLLLYCKIKGLTVTMLSGNLDEISEVQLDADSESTAATLDIYEREARLVIDYSELQPQLKNLQAKKEIEENLERLRDSVSHREGVLHNTTAPNLKALEKMREVKEKLQEVMDAFDISTKAAKKCSYEFEQVKARRFQLFSRCFEHVSVTIDQIYKRICRNSSAQAILTAENPDEPYLGGINYNCVAPGKRFMSMDNLSGGEKAIAALALIFALQSLRPPPFFVLDEVDAALDNTNIGKVTSFIREESRGNTQVIVISHKQEFFCKADALLGVYSDFSDCMFSRILTLDLRPFPLDEEESEKQIDESGAGKVAA